MNENELFKVLEKILEACYKGKVITMFEAVEAVQAEQSSETK